MADDRKEYFIKKNMIHKDFETETIKYHFLKIFEDKKSENVVEQNKDV